MRHPMLAAVLGAAALALAPAAGAPLGAQAAAAASATRPPTDTTRPLRPNPRLRPRPAAPVPRRPEATAGDRLAPAPDTAANAARTGAATGAATGPSTPVARGTTPTARGRRVGSGVRARKDSAAARDATRRP